MGPPLWAQILTLLQGALLVSVKTALLGKLCSKTPRYPHPLLLLTLFPRKTRHSLAVPHLGASFWILVGLLEGGQWQNQGRYLTEVVSQTALQKVVKAPTGEKGKRR